jgi:hypothetical protein
MSSVPSLDEKCGDNFCYRDFIECGETFAALQPNNVPKEHKSYAALRELTQEILDPVWSEFGKLELTYGLSCRDLHRQIIARISPPLDQHASYELNTRGSQICKRGGAAVDFRCSEVGSLEVAQWLVSKRSFDRLYFYGSERPIHVSIGPDQSRQVVLMQQSAVPGRRIPRKTSTQDFIGFKEDDDLIKSCTANPGGQS